MDMIIRPYFTIEILNIYEIDALTRTATKTLDQTKL